MCNIWTLRYEILMWILSTTWILANRAFTHDSQPLSENLMFVWPCILNMKWFVRPTWCNNYDLLINFCSTCFGHHYAHLQERTAVYNSIWFSALNVLAGVLRSRGGQVVCWKPYAVIYGLTVLKMGIMVPETRRAKGWLINHNCCINLVSQITLPDSFTVFYRLRIYRKIYTKKGVKAININ